MSTRLQLVAIAYPEEFLAAEAAEELDRSAEEHLIEHVALSVAVCDSDGNRQLTSSREPATGASWGKLWTALQGSLHDGTEADGIEPEFREWLSGVLRPQTSVLLIVLAATQHQAVTGILAPLGGVSNTSPLSNDLVE